MRIYDIALFIFIFNLALGMVNEMGIVSPKYNKNPAGNYNMIQIQADQEDLMVKTSQQSSNIVTDAINFVEDSIKLVTVGVPMLLKSLWNATLGLYGLLTSFGVPSTLAMILWTVCNFVYLVGAYQMFTGRSVKDVSQ
jgi:hypothetical protein